MLRLVVDDIDGWMAEPLCSVSPALDGGQVGNLAPPTTGSPQHAASALVAASSPPAIAVNTSSDVAGSSPQANLKNTSQKLRL